MQTLGQETLLNRQVILLKDRVAAVREGGKGIHVVVVIHGCFAFGSRKMRGTTREKNKA